MLIPVQYIQGMACGGGVKLLTKKLQIFILREHNNGTCF